MSDTRELPVRLGAELSAAAVSFSGELLVLLAPKAFPPGQPLDLTLFPGEARELALQARCIGSKLQADQRFEVRAKLINLSRHTRTAVAAAFS